ncbi:MAG: hypothetical protein HYT62_03545, partial [Candidatus Yanofskybacteria bacterium]|nr:hypothetical protein [Candidatus Yanofskybacteria bacterium]
MDAKSLGRALGLIELIVVTIMTAIRKHGADVFAVVSDEKLRELTNQFVDGWVAAGKAMSNLFRLNVGGGNRTTEKVVVAGDYKWSNPNINSQLFPWRRRQGKRTVELVDMTQHGFAPGSIYTFSDALAVLVKLGLEQPVYEDGLLFGEQHPEKQREQPIMFPHEPVVVGGGPDVVYLWSAADVRELGLSWAGDRWSSGVLVAGVR